MVTALRPQAQDVANRISQLGSVQGKKVKIHHARGLQLSALFGGGRNGHHAPGFLIVFQSLEQMRHPGRHGGAAGLGELRGLNKVTDRQDARHDRYPDAGGARTLQKAQIDIGVKEELRNGTGGAGIDLAFQIIQIGMA